MRMRNVFDPDLHFNRKSRNNFFDTITPDVGDLTGLRELFEPFFFLVSVSLNILY